MKIAKLLLRLLTALLALGVLCFGALEADRDASLRRFLGLEAVVLAGCRDETGRDAPVMIVLGAKLWQDGPSPVLELRLEKALEYWREHPETELILSGGQGADEPESEAGAMAEWLEERGVPGGQLHLEERSTNTAENLRYSMQLMEQLGYDPESTPAVVVSSAFHLARVRLLCGRYGLEADTLGAPMPDGKSAVYSYTREAFALLKSFFFD